MKPNTVATLVADSSGAWISIRQSGHKGRPVDTVRVISDDTTSSSCRSAVVSVQTTGRATTSMKPPPSRSSGESKFPRPAAHQAFPDRPPTQTLRVASPPSTRSAPPTLPRYAPIALSKAIVEDCTPRVWSECFDRSTDIELPTRKGTWRVYDAGITEDCDLVTVFFHGGGQCALSWALVAAKLKEHCAVVAFDARGHGDTVTEQDGQLSADSQVKDSAVLIQAFMDRTFRAKKYPRLVICGHSMGGSMAVRLSVANLFSNVVGLVVIDVVEGTAMSALPYMRSWLERRPKSFGSQEAAIRYVMRAGHVRNAHSARMSVPAQVVYDYESKRWNWRTNLKQTTVFWEGWFQGLSQLFLSVPAAKMLVLASVDRLDKDLMIAQMQGKFQNILIPGAGHTVHEDQPGTTAQVILEFLQRNLLVSTEKSGGTAIYQQRSPIPPCC